MPAEPDLTSDECDDIQLMTKVAAGDEIAFRALIERHQNAVVGTVAKMMGSPTDAEDIAQQVFLRIWKSAKRYKPQAKFTTYLFTITRNLVFNETKKRSRRKNHSLDEAQENTDLQLPSGGTNPDQDLRQKELQQTVNAAIAALPEAQRTALILRRYEDMSYEDIAAVMKCSVSSIKSHLFRARGSLRESLASYLDS